MGRGRPYAMSPGVHYIHRRAVSLPADESRYSRDVSYQTGTGSQKANVIAGHAAQDTDAIISASRRHDRDFLHDVATKMAAINNVHTLPPQTHHSRETSPAVHRRPPPSPSRGSFGQVPAGIYRSALSPDEHMEIASYLQRTPASTTTSLHRRAASVPPPGVSAPRPSVPRWFPSSVGTYHGRRTGSHGRPASLAVPTSYGHPGDAVVGVAHTSLYGDIVIGIPTKKRYMFNAQHDANNWDTQSLPPVHLNVPTRVSSSPTAPAHHHHHHHQHQHHHLPLPLPLPPHHHHTSLHGKVLTQPYTRASYAGPFGDYHVTTTTSGGADIDDVISMKSYSGTSAVRAPHRSAKNVELENDIANSIFGDTNVPHTTSLSKDYKAVLNRYLPSNGPRTLTPLNDNELNKKYGHILTSLQPRMSPRLSVASSVPTRSDYARSSLPPPVPTNKPKRAPMSDTRKKLRDLLCRSKNDPHYFDD